MQPETRESLNAINRAVVQFRGIYSAWASAHGISYNEMLVLYTIRDQGYCTQKQICDSYLLPRQTINHVIAAMRAAGLLEYSKAHSAGREKAFVLTEQGREYAKPFLRSLEEGETAALEQMGPGKLRALCSLLEEYDRALQRTLEENHNL